MNKDNYHEQGNIIIMLLLLPLGHISNIYPNNLSEFLDLIDIHGQLISNSGSKPLTAGLTCARPNC